MRILHTLTLILLLGTTLAIYGQSQETVDAIQDARLRQIEVSADATEASVGALVREMASLRSSLDRFTGIGIGLGAALTSLQGLLVIITIRNGKKA